MKKLFLVPAIAMNLSSSFASEPVSACRATHEALNETRGLTNSAGCVITRETKEGALEVLTIYTKKNGGGYAFPGGKPATFKNDLKEMKKKKGTKAKSFISLSKKIGAKSFISHIEYTEPVACAAARETKEETGLDVIIGSVIDFHKYFIAFNCYAPKGQSLKAIDTDEVKEGAFRWVSKTDFNIMKNNKKGKTTNRFVYENNLGVLEKVFN